MSDRQIIGYDLIDSVCDECKRLASWRVVNQRTGVPWYAACPDHKRIVRARYLFEMYGEPLPEDHPDAIDAEVTRLELRKEGY